MCKVLLFSRGVSFEADLKRPWAVCILVMVMTSYSAFSICICSNAAYIQFEYRGDIRRQHVKETTSPHHPPTYPPTHTHTENYVPYSFLTLMWALHYVPYYPLLMLIKLNITPKAIKTSNNSVLRLFQSHQCVTVSPQEHLLHLREPSPIPCEQSRFRYRVTRLRLVSRSFYVILGMEWRSNT